MKVKERGSFDNIENYLARHQSSAMDETLAYYGQLGCDALLEATPKRTGLTSQSWHYRIRHAGKKTYLEWYNDNIQNGSVVAILIQYGFVTPTGYKVEGRDYINPALKPIIEELEKAVKGE